MPAGHARTFSGQQQHQRDGGKGGGANAAFHRGHHRTNSAPQPIQGQGEKFVAQPETEKERQQNLLQIQNSIMDAIATPSRNAGRRDAGRRDRERGMKGGNPSNAQNANGASNGRASASPLEECLRQQGIDEAWNLLEENQKNNTMSDKFTVSRMLMKTVGDGRSPINQTRVYRAIALVENFIDSQPTDVDEVLFNALLDTCCRLRDIVRLESTMRRMRDLNIRPSAVTLGILVKTYGQAGDLSKVLDVWSEMVAQRGQANAVTYGCMLDACVKCGNLMKAMEVFADMKRDGKHRNTILYTTLIKGFGLDKNLEGAITLFEEMKAEGVPYNTITYNSIIDVCIKCSELQRAEELLQQMLLPGSNVMPDLITFSTLLKGYCHTGEIDKALRMSETIKDRGLRRDELVYNTLMDGCVKSNDINTGVGLFEEMVQAGMKPSTITHSILLRLYKRAGYENDPSEAVAALYKHHGIDRPVGGERGRGPGGRRDDRDKLRSPNNGLGRRDRGDALGFRGKGGSPHSGQYGMDCDSLQEKDQMRLPQTPAFPAGPFLPVEALRSPNHGGMMFPDAGTMTPGSMTPGSCTPGNCTPGGFSSGSGQCWPMGMQGSYFDGSISMMAQFASSCPGTPGSYTPGNCTPGGTYAGTGSWFGMAAGDGSMSAFGGDPQMAQPGMGSAPPHLPPWPTDANFMQFPAMTMGMATSSNASAMSSSANVCPPMQCSGMMEMAPQPLPLPTGQTLSPGASPLRHVERSESPDREDCPGTPEQYASYPMPQCPAPPSQNDVSQMQQAFSFATGPGVELNFATCMAPAGSMQAPQNMDGQMQMGWVAFNPCGEGQQMQHNGAYGGC